jgi:hypothetical protein
MLYMHILGAYVILYLLAIFRALPVYHSLQLPRN